ncbi:MAG TPA: extracellular solute-binding protein [Firmicutes bacterium]|nr:extracellular solute-binding protein [Bacillota bacterium]
MKRVMSMLLALSMTLSLVAGGITVSAEDVANTEGIEDTAVAAVDTAAGEEEDDSPLYEERVSYAEYISEYASVPDGQNPIVIQAADYTASEGEVQVHDGYEGVSGKVVESGEDGFLEWEVDIPADGLYSINISYYTVAGKSSDIERELRIDGEVPFSEAAVFTLKRNWVNEEYTEEQKQEEGWVEGQFFQRDNQGNDIRPTQVEVPMWTETDLVDSDGLTIDPFKFYFSQGKHTIRLTSVKEPVIFEKITLFTYELPESYAEVSAEYTMQDTSGHKIMIQGEDAVLKSDASLYPISDKSSAYTIPTDLKSSRLNTIGSTNWNLPNQWIQWEFEVPEDGLYTIGMRFRQSTSISFPATRELTIDGEVPFSEAKMIHFNYDTAFQSMWISDAEGNPYKFELTAGTHTIRLKMNMGEVAEILRSIQELVLDLTDLYTRIIMITGPSPDIYRDYRLDARLPDLIDQLTSLQARLQEQADAIVALSSSSTNEAAVIDQLIQQIEEMIENPDVISNVLSNFKSNISSLASWALTARNQPVEIDYLVVASPDQEMDPAEPGFFEGAWYEIKKFFVSFTIDDSSIGNAYQEDEEDVITVWATLGRDQATTLKKMIDYGFTKETGIKVNFNILSNESTLLYATASGEGPDVALGTSGTLPIDYGVRNALVDLSKLEGFDEVQSWFMPSAFTPYTYGDAVYALPQTQGFMVMFYRKDILGELGIKVPETWEEFYTALGTIQENNLDVSPGGLPIFTTMLYQRGGQYYSDDLSECLLDSPESVQSFQEYCELYTLYGLPVSSDFYNRFRNGEMPLGFGDYTLYNQIAVAAPEIKGLWGMAALPGTVQEDGTINNAIAGNGGTSCVMLAQVGEGTKKQENAWEFMKWWMSTETQVEYARELEAILGAAARYNTANIEAVSYLAWPRDIYDTIITQWRNVVETPVVPGSYYTSRHLNNAFNEVINNIEVPRESIVKYTEEITLEIQAKREELNLND